MNPCTTIMKKNILGYLYPIKFAIISGNYMNIKQIVVLFPQKLDDPLEGNVLKVKVPFRYRRVMCNVDGDTPVQSLKKGDTVLTEIQFNGVWNAHDHSGYSWVLKYIKYRN